MKPILLVRTWFSFLESFKHFKVKLWYLVAIEWRFWCQTCLRFLYCQVIYIICALLRIYTQSLCHSEVKQSLIRILSNMCIVLVVMTQYFPGRIWLIFEYFWMHMIFPGWDRLYFPSLEKSDWECFVTHCDRPNFNIWLCKTQERERRATRNPREPDITTPGIMKLYLIHCWSTVRPE